MSLLEVSHLQKIFTTRFGGNQVEALYERVIESHRRSG